jgi:hypothetical protein
LSPLKVTIFALAARLRAGSWGRPPFEVHCMPLFDGDEWQPVLVRSAASLSSGTVAGNPCIA